MKQFKFYSLYLCIEKRLKVLVARPRTQEKERERMGGRLEQFRRLFKFAAKAMAAKTHSHTLTRKSLTQTPGYNNTHTHTYKHKHANTTMH